MDAECMARKAFENLSNSRVSKGEKVTRADYWSLCGLVRHEFTSGDCTRQEIECAEPIILNTIADLIFGEKHKSEEVENTLSTKRLAKECAEDDYDMYIEHYGEESLKNR